MVYRIIITWVFSKKRDFTDSETSVCIDYCKIMYVWRAVGGSHSSYTRMSKADVLIPLLAQIIKQHSRFYEVEKNQNHFLSTKHLHVMNLQLLD